MNRRDVARLFRAASNEKRIMILKALKSDMTINKLADYTGLPYKTVERHLKILAAAHVVKQSRQGLEVIFKINNTGNNYFVNTIVKMVHMAK